VSWRSEVVERNRHHCAREGICRHPGAWKPWLPLKPLLRVSGLRPYQLAVLLGVSGGTMKTWLRRDALPLLWTDRAAVAIGLHPVNVWPEWYEAIEVLIEKARARD